MIKKEIVLMSKIWTIALGVFPPLVFTIVITVLSLIPDNIVLKNDMDVNSEERLRYANTCIELQMTTLTIQNHQLAILLEHALEDTDIARNIAVKNTIPTERREYGK